jgi:hypothetical protein
VLFIKFSPERLAILVAYLAAAAEKIQRKIAKKVTHCHLPAIFSSPVIALKSTIRQFPGIAGAMERGTRV